MNEERNRSQIIRKDARSCFVESLNDFFEVGKIHLVFASYDLNRPAGQRQTNNIHIFIGVDEGLELCRKLECGEFRQLLHQRKTSGDKAPLYQCLGGTSAEKLAKWNRSRPDGMSLSRTAQLVAGSKSDLLFVANSGPGQTDVKGLIVPKFGSKPENHVAVSMTFETFSELMLMTRTHYMAWLSAWYARQGPMGRLQQEPPHGAGSQPEPQAAEYMTDADYAANDSAQFF